MSTKLTRRNLLKVLGGAGAFLMAAPHLSKISTMAEAAPFGADPTVNTGETLVVLVRNGGLVGLRGNKELAIRDELLASKLSRMFAN